MGNDLGVYIAIQPDVKLKRDLVARSGKIPLEDSTVEQEIIDFSELKFGPYASVVDYIAITANYMIEDYREHAYSVDSNVFDFMMDTVNDLLETFEDENPLHGTLTRTAVEDRIPEDDGTELCAIETASTIVAPLQEVILFQRLSNQVLSDLRNNIPLDFAEKYQALRRTEFTQTFFMGSELTTRYYFRSPADYYRFLLLNFITKGPVVGLCECCGKFFVPRTRRKTFYCDRIIKDGKTCKELGPRLKHKLESMNKKVIEEFDRARQRMYKRYERARDKYQRPSERDLTYSDFYEWLDRATQAREKFLAGEISEEDALKIIVVP